jgi:hypothetical protein
MPKLKPKSRQVRRKPKPAKPAVKKPRPTPNHRDD